ncbi:hypothetical protein RO3G_01658 [Rhizopus delemar RA 99-880]|uniref:Uncharacterized protein n=1 Tax=Rhizopus delemar (strain RA 99-880 / ATCC MYA-4621 / FGSC 9543 / NRRL 43880) TaxID=246409 RepID=I1BL74_RHIO9|nr:hypothetical protein RO3G_01658 [Rhizopus delemar RA 99-880]|eukprot:EIE76954.1 hypothetical protein RO3G_01658 [Rhizopus delemar RA 99-880]
MYLFMLIFFFFFFFFQIVPVFYGTYTALGLVNTIIYLDEVSNYPSWAIALVFIGIGVLVYGVALLSSKSDPTLLSEEEELQDISSTHWLTEKEEKELQGINTAAGDSSNHGGCQQHQESKNSFLKKIQYLFIRRTSPLPRREMDTFISLHSQTDNTIPLVTK